VVPVAGPSGTTDTVITPGPDSDESLPRLARGLTEDWGHRFRLHATDADVIVAVRSYLGLFALGLARATNAPVIVDLDDDDADFFRQRGDLAESQRFESLVSRLRERGAHLVSASGFDSTHRVPNTAPQPASMSRLATVPARIVIVGNFRYEPNAEGAQWFIDSVLPLVHEHAPSVELRLVGPASERFAPYGVGIVDDLAMEYSQAALAACPILIGSGTRTKIIEAWMHGVPVVSTTIGADGLGASHDESILLADEPFDFANQIVRLTSDDELARRLSTSARTVAENLFSPDVVASAVSDIALPLVTDRSRMYVMASNLHLTETDDGLVVLDHSNDSVHNLNSTASMVLYLADGTLDPQGIAEEIRLALDLTQPPTEHVIEAIGQLCRIGLISARFV
jgi:glycosyltransferase involved in cell wall biosynthesis